jgi:hypothetical protein
MLRGEEERASANPNKSKSKAKIETERWDRDSLSRGESPSHFTVIASEVGPGLHSMYREGEDRGIHAQHHDQEQIKSVSVIVNVNILTQSQKHTYTPDDITQHLSRPVSEIDAALEITVQYSDLQLFFSEESVSMHDIY